MPEQWFSGTFPELESDIMNPEVKQRGRKRQRGLRKTPPNPKGAVGNLPSLPTPVLFHELQDTPAEEEQVLETSLQFGCTHAGCCPPLQYRVVLHDLN